MILKTGPIGLTNQIVNQHERNQIGWTDFNIERKLEGFDARVDEIDATKKGIDVGEEESMLIGLDGTVEAIFMTMCRYQVWMLKISTFATHRLVNG